MLASLCFGCVLLLATGGAAPALSVHGDSDCPTAEEVSVALLGLVVSPDPSGAQDVVALSGRGQSVNVRLESPTGELIAEKRLPAGPSCAERARMAAVMVAAWEVRLRTGAQPPLLLSQRDTRGAATMPARAPATPAAQAPPTRPPIPGPSMPAPSATPIPPVAPAASTPRIAPSPPAAPPPSVPAPPGPTIRSPSPERGADIVAASPGTPTPSPNPIEVETAAAFLASVTAGALSPAAMLEVTVSRRYSRLVLGIGALAVGTHATPVGSGVGSGAASVAGSPEGTWRRFGGVVDLRSRAGWRSLELEMRAGLALTALDIRGQSLPVTSGSTMFDPGVLVGLRLRFRLGRVAPWVEAATAIWPRTHSLYISQTPSSSEIPPFEVLLGAGVSLTPDR